MSKIWTESEEAGFLAARFEDVRNRAEFARQHAIPGGPAMIHQHTSGKRPIGLEAAMAYSRAFGCKLEEISPRLAAKAVEAAGLVGRVPERKIPAETPRFIQKDLDDAIDRLLGLFGLNFEGYARLRMASREKRHTIQHGERSMVLPDDGNEGKKEG